MTTQAHTISDQHEPYMNYARLIEERADTSITNDERHKLITEINRTIHAMPMSQFLDIKIALFRLVDNLTKKLEI